LIINTIIIRLVTVSFESKKSLKISKGGNQKL
jgi:hypothetical protein